MKHISNCLLSVIAIVFVTLAAGCGQSGALYIPGNPSQMTVPPASPAGEEDDDEETAAPPPQ